MKQVVAGLTLVVAFGLLFPPPPADAQDARKGYRVGFLGNANPTLQARSLDAFRQGLRELGWVEGQNISIEYRWADGNLDRHPALVSDLVKLRVDVIVLAGTQATRAARQATGTIPIVAAIFTDPVALGFAASLARPGGNVTGLSNQFEDLVPKQMQILKEIVPKAARLGILDYQASPTVRQAAETAARALAFEAQIYETRDGASLEGVFMAAKRGRADAVHVLPSPFFSRHRARLAELALRYRLPAIYEAREYVEAGGLMSYGPSFPGMYRRAASYVDRILKGANPGELPIEQPTNFELVINLKTAKALGLTIPRSVLIRADEGVQ